ILNVASGAHRGLSVRRQQGGSTGRGVDVVAGLAGGLARLFRSAGRARGGVARGHAFASERVVDDVLVRINLGARRRPAAQGAGAGVGARIGALQRLVQRVAQVAAIGLLAHGGGFAAFVVFGLGVGHADLPWLDQNKRPGGGAVPSGLRAREAGKKKGRKRALPALDASGDPEASSYLPNSLAHWRG